MDSQQAYPDPTEIRHTIGATGQLTINNVSGSVELRAADGGEVVVNVRSENGRVDWLPIAVRQSDGLLAIDVEKRSSFGMFGSLFGANDGLEFEITVPRAARLTVNTVSADVNAQFVSGEQNYKTVSGDIQIDPDGGRIRAATVSGDIHARPAEPAELSTSSTSGDVFVQASVLNLFEARTVSGDIELEAGLAAGPLHTIETVSGDLSIESPTGVTVDVKSGLGMRRGSRGFVSGDGAAKVRFRTLSGDCHLEGAQRIRSEDDDEDDDWSGRHGRHGRHGHSLERRIERQVQRMTRGIGPDFDFPPMPGRPPMPPMPPNPPTGSRPPSYEPEAAAPSQRQAQSQLDVLRALERGEIDVDEAARRLQEA